MTPPTRVLALDDGDAWELVGPGSTALVVEVTEFELERLHAGEPVGLVLAGRRGQRLAVVLDAVPCAPVPSDGERRENKRGE